MEMKRMKIDHRHPWDGGVIGSMSQWVTLERVNARLGRVFVYAGANREVVDIYSWELDRSQWVKGSEVIYTLRRGRYSTRKGWEKAYYVQTPQDQASVIAQQTQ